MSLVTVICLCYNHARFIEEAVESVVSQSYQNIELIIVNDGSSDDSRLEIESLCRKYPSISFINNEKNIGMCRSFNKALSNAKGDYIIDLAGDDVLLPERIEKQVKAFGTLDDSYGVVFSDAFITNERGERLRTFYRRSSKGKIEQEVLSGDVFSKVVRKYQIHAPTIMVRKATFDYLGGYDENLSYEDYDFYIRSSRRFKYFFLDEILTVTREVKGSNSSSFYKLKVNPHLTSTLTILKKYIWLSKDEWEIDASVSSIRYNMRQYLFLECFDLAKKYYHLLEDINKRRFFDSVLYYLASLKIPLSRFYKLYSFIAHR